MLVMAPNDCRGKIALYLGRCLFEWQTLATPHPLSHGHKTIVSTTSVSQFNPDQHPSLTAISLIQADAGSYHNHNSHSRVANVAFFVVNFPSLTAESGAGETGRARAARAGQARAQLLPGPAATISDNVLMKSTKYFPS